MSAGGQFSAQVAAALARGDKIQAIKLIRESGGLGLKEALAAVEAYAARASAGGAAPGHDAIRAALKQGNVVEAIRRTREANPGMDLQTAKQAVDALRRNASMAAAGNETKARAVQAKADRTPTVVEGDRGGYAIVFLAIAAAVGALVWWWLGT